jgi:hypothetical protein
VFAAALLPRLLLAWITFGSKDIGTCFRNTTWLLSGRELVLPYFPGVELLIWIGGALAYFTPIPAAAAYKLIPVLFDAAIAVLLRDARSLRSGLLYAIAPAPIVVMCMHGQWDGIVLYFLALAVVLRETDHRIAQPLAGVAWFLSVITKPVALPLLPLFLLPWGDRRRSANFLGGVCGAAVVYVLLLMFTGHLASIERLALIFLYGAAGQGFFGLPILTTSLFRYWTLLPALAIFGVFGTGRISRADGVFLFLAFAMANSQLAPQYLCWLAPFALLSGRLRFGSLYTLIAGTFLVLFYRTITVNTTTIIFAGAYGLLTPFAALTPPPASELVARALVITGNYVLPLFCLGYAIAVLVRSRKEAVPAPFARLGPGVAMPAAILLVLVVVTVSWAAAAPEIAPAAFVDRILHKVEAYDVIRYETRQNEDLTWVPRRMAKPSLANPVLNLSSILLVLVAVSAVMTWRGADE